MGGIDILINCAGVIFAGDLESTFPQDYDYLVDVNVRTPWLLTTFFSQCLKRSKGCIVNVSCEKGSRPEPGILGYCMTKAGLEMLTKTSALELAPFGVRVNAVAPCMVDETNLYRYAGYNETENESLKKRAAANIPIRRVARDEEVAKAIIFLSSEK
jgi:NAD(P)-dependent dehydrogenase (short-subunit alcohol dehydrogenase family)